MTTSQTQSIGWPFRVLVHMIGKIAYIGCTKQKSLINNPIDIGKLRYYHQAFCAHLPTVN
jgi:hypothetical protein